MQVPELQKMILENSIPAILIFFGEEHAVMDVYIQKICNTLKSDVVHCELTKEAYSKMVKRRIAGGKRLFLVREDAEFIKADKDWAKVFSAAEKSGDTLLLTYASLDKRTKFYKQNTERLCEFQRLGMNVLSNYIQKLLPGFDSSASEKLIEICDFSYNRILLEVDKVRHYSNLHNLSYVDSFNYLCSRGIIYQPIGDITFEFTDSILLRNKRKAIRMLSMAKNKGESEILTLSVLYNGFRNILMVQGLGPDKSEPVKRTGLTAWQVKLAKEKMGHYTIPELINALKTIRFVEKGIKTGLIDVDIAVDYVMVNVM